MWLWVADIETVFWSAQRRLAWLDHILLSRAATSLFYKRSCGFPPNRTDRAFLHMKIAMPFRPELSETPQRYCSEPSLVIA
ncbi:unnamed protein product [Dracunculus medinensis]|uniref:Secreted protein n=1 Tax=Dracunculus medinensis TaxID=318479 RepID=A0A0N4U204_DRAME|nr:unnamed protein product [Dracunculus medinensis]